MSDVDGSEPPGAIISLPEREDPPTVREGDLIIVGDAPDHVAMDVKTVYADGSFMLEWQTPRGKRGQVFRERAVMRNSRVVHVRAAAHRRTYDEP